MKKGILLVTLLFILTFTAPTQSNAAYDASSDWSISVNLLDDAVQTNSMTGDLTFQLQEEGHSLITNTSGAELDHSYIWIKLNGNNLLAIDPIKPSF